jgi:hypothetical protein
MFDNILTAVFLSSTFLFGIPGMFILPYTLGKKFDRIMQQHNLSLPASFGIAPPHVYRANMYAINIVLFPDPKKHPNKMKQYRHWFGNFCFREFASTWDKIQAWSLILMLGIMILSLAVIAIEYLIQYMIRLF